MTTDVKGLLTGLVEKLKDMTAVLKTKKEEGAKVKATHMPVSKEDLAKLAGVHKAMGESLETHKEAGTMTDNAHKDMAGHHAAIKDAMGSYMSKVSKEEGAKPGDEPTEGNPGGAPADKPPKPTGSSEKEDAVSVKMAAMKEMINQLMATVEANTAETARLRKAANAPKPSAEGVTVIHKGREIQVNKGNTPAEIDALDELKKLASRNGPAGERARMELLRLNQAGVLGGRGGGIVGNRQGIPDLASTNGRK